MIGNIQKLLGLRSKHQSLVFIISFIILFWTIFDSILTYILPMLMEERGLSMSAIGLIIGTSSISGVFFDFLICKIFKNTDFRRIFLIMFIICFIYPMLLWQANTVWFFLFVMSVWGIYYDFYGFGTFNFVGRFVKVENHSSSFGLIQIFRALGGIIAPILVGLVIAEKVEWSAFVFSWFFLGIGFALFVFLVIIMRKHNPINIEEEKHKKRRSFFVEIHLWEKLSKMMLPVLFITFYLFFVEAFFWTLAPLYTETINLGKFSGIFLTAYTLPALFVGLIVPSLTKKFGKRKTALISTLIGSVLLSSFVILSNPILEIIIVFIASCFLSLAFPAINAAYADYISEAPQVENEIEGIEDSSFNIAYVLGPFAAGIFADVFGIQTAFSILGLIGVILAIILVIVNPKKIVIRTKPSEL
jgi:MFS family permease